MTMRIESIQPHDDPRFSVIAVRTEPSRLARMFGQEDTLRHYVGAGTAWYDEEHKPVVGPIRSELAEAWTGALITGTASHLRLDHVRSERSERSSHGDGRPGLEPVITLKNAS